MRSLILSIALSFLAAAAAAFEVEEVVQFDARTEPARVLRVISTADVVLFAPVVDSFQDLNPDVTVIYTVVSSAEVPVAIAGEDAAFDLAISSAMDLQMQLANDGWAQPFSSDVTQRLPDWARWNDRVFAFTQEPATLLLSRADFEGLPLPRTRQDLIAIMRDHADRFNGRIGTYDLRQSGLGYLFATQDGRSSETYWRLTEVMGALQTQLYCCSSEMIEDVASGRIAVAYNVLGSYAHARSDLADAIHVIAPDDFTTVMLRTALIPRTAAQPELAGMFIDHLISTVWNEGGRGFSFPGISPEAMAVDASLRPIHMGPGLLVFLDRLKRQQFLAEWEAAVLQAR